MKIKRLCFALAAACASTTCTATAAGFGLVAHLGAHLRATRLAVRRSDLAGVVVGQAASVDLMDGEIADSPIGANVQVPGYDLARLSNQVVYRDVERALDSTSLPVPDPISPIARP